MVGGYLAGNNTGNDTGIILNYTKPSSLCQEPSPNRQRCQHESRTGSASVVRQAVFLSSTVAPRSCHPERSEDLVPRPTTAVHCAERDSSSCGFRMTGWVHACHPAIRRPWRPRVFHPVHSHCPQLRHPERSEGSRSVPYDGRSLRGTRFFVLRTQNDGLGTHRPSHNPPPLAPQGLPSCPLPLSPIMSSRTW